MTNILMDNQTAMWSFRKEIPPLERVLNTVKQYKSLNQDLIVDFDPNLLIKFDRIHYEDQYCFANIQLLIDLANQYNIECL